MFYWPKLNSKLNSTQNCYEKYKKFMNSKSSQISNSVWLNGSLHDLYINNFARRSMIQQQMLSNLHCTLTDFLQNYIRNAHCILPDFFFTTLTMHFQECFLGKIYQLCCLKNQNQQSQVFEKKTFFFVFAMSEAIN